MSNFEFHKQLDLETTVGLPQCRPLTDANHPNLKRFKMHFYKSQIEVSFNKAYISIIIQVDPAYLIKLPHSPRHDSWFKLPPLTPPISNIDKGWKSFWIV